MSCGNGRKLELSGMMLFEETLERVAFSCRGQIDHFSELYATTDATDQFNAL